MKYTYDDDADVRTTTLIRVMALFFVGIMIIAATTSPIATGTKEGERAPALEGAVKLCFPAVMAKHAMAYGRKAC